MARPAEDEAAEPEWDSQDSNAYQDQAEGLQLQGLIDLREELIKHCESQRLGGTVTGHGYDAVRHMSDFTVELDGDSYSVEIRRLP